MLALSAISTDLTAGLFLAALVLACVDQFIAKGRSILAWAVIVATLALAWNALAST